VIVELYNLLKVFLGFLTQVCFRIDVALSLDLRMLRRYKVQHNCSDYQAGI